MVSLLVSRVDRCCSVPRMMCFSRAFSSSRVMVLCVITL